MKITQLQHRLTSQLIITVRLLCGEIRIPLAKHIILARVSGKFPSVTLLIESESQRLVDISSSECRKRLGEEAIRVDSMKK